MSDRNERHQADKLMELFREVANHNPNELLEESHLSNDIEEKSDDYVELDILNLPPRREVHRKNKNRYSFSLAKPFTRLFIVVIILFIILLLTYFDISEQIFSFFYFI